MSGPEPTEAGQPDNRATPEQIAELVNQLNIPYRPPHTITETCPCCKQPTGTYWAIPQSWEPTA